jgi:hypothetical protein
VIFEETDRPSLEILTGPQVLADRLTSIETDPPARRYGRVLVASPAQLRGRTFEVVFIPALAERMFPQKPREDPLLLDEAREHAAALPDFVLGEPAPAGAYPAAPNPYPAGAYPVAPNPYPAPPPCSTTLCCP